MPKNNMTPRPINPPTFALVTLYLVAIVGANLVATHWGQPGMVVAALVLIPFDFIVRDVLHARWFSKGGPFYVALCLLMLLMSGAFVSTLIDHASQRIAIASVIAFAAAFVVNSILFAKWSWIPMGQRMVFSALFTGFVDSLIFPWIAFGAIQPELSVLQFIMKLAGSAAWAFVFTRQSKPMQDDVVRYRDEGQRPMPQLQRPEVLAVTSYSVKYRLNGQTFTRSRKGYTKQYGLPELCRHCHRTCGTCICDINHELDRVRQAHPNDAPQ